MRLTVNLEADLYLTAKSLAIAQDCSISAAINQLLRRKLEPTPIPKRRKNSFPVAPGRRRFTSEDVYRIEQL